MNSDLQELGGHDPHGVLGVREGASRQEVARAFRRSAAHGVHPDAGGDARAFRRLARARDVLLEPRRLDAYLAARQAAGYAPAGARPDPAPARRDHEPEATPPDHQPSAPGTRRRAHLLLFVALVLALGGPLLWPPAILVGLIALGLEHRRPRPSRAGSN